MRTLKRRGVRRNLRCDGLAKGDLAIGLAVEHIGKEGDGRTYGGEKEIEGGMVSCKQWTVSSVGLVDPVLGAKATWSIRDHL